MALAGFLLQITIIFSYWTSCELTLPSKKSHCSVNEVSAIIRHPGSSNRPWQSRQTGPISSGVTRNPGTHAQTSKYSPHSLSKGPSPISLPPSLSSSLWLCISLPSLFCIPVNGTSRATYFTFDMAAHKDGEPTGPPGTCWRPSPLLTSSMSVNMKVSKEHRSIIQNLHLLKGYTACKLLIEFPSKRWSRRDLYRLVMNVRHKYSWQASRVRQTTTYAFNPSNTIRHTYLLPRLIKEYTT